SCSSCQFQRYLRIRADRAEINANVAMLFANGVCERDLPRDSSMPSDLVMICQWASLFTQSMDSRIVVPPQKRTRNSRFSLVFVEESGDSVPRTPWDFSLWACSGRTGPGPGCCLK